MKKLLSTLLFGFLGLASYAGEEIRLSLVDSDVVFEYTSSTGDWYFGATDESGKYSVHLDYFADRAGRYGTYTDADLDPEYSFVRYYSGEDLEDFQIGNGSEFTLAEDEGYYTLVGRLICSDGNTYVLDGRFKMHEPQTYDVECQYITYMEYYEEEHDWYIRFKNDDYKFTFDLVSQDGQFSGTYTEADALYEGSCFVTDLNEDDDIPFASFSVTMQQSEDVDTPEKGCEITGTATTDNGDVYRFHMVKYPPIKPIKEVAVDVELVKAEWPCYDLASDASYYELTEIENPDVTWKLACYRLIGEVTEEEMDTDLTARIEAATGRELKLDNGKVTQTLDADAQNVIVKAELVMSDSVQYNFTFSNPIMVNDTLSFSFTDLWIDTSYAEYGSITLNASDDASSFCLSLADAEVPGSYDTSNASITLCFADSEGYDVYVNSLVVVMAECTMAEDGSPLLDCCFIGDDMNFYTVKASFVLPEITEELDLQITEAYFYDETCDANGFSISYNTEDYDMICYLKVLSGDEVSGHYGIDQLDNSSYLLLSDAEGRQQTLRFYTGEFDVTYCDDIVTLTGVFQAGNYAVTLRITTAELLPVAIDKVRTEGRGDSCRINIFGQRVDSRYRGFCISDGKKVLN